jgi:hypothetical protein
LPASLAWVVPAVRVARAAASPGDRAACARRGGSAASPGRQGPPAIRTAPIGPCAARYCRTWGRVVAT